MPRNDGTLTFVRPGGALYGEVRAGYLVTIVRGGRERSLVWRPPQPLPLDLREEWEMHWMPEGMSARQFSGSGETRRPRQIVPIPDRAIDSGAAVALFGSPDNDRPDFAVRVQRLRPILAPNKRASAPRNVESEAYLFTGAGDNVTDAVPVRNQFSVVVDDRRAVEFVGEGNGATLIAAVHGFQCRVGEDVPIELIPNVPFVVDLSTGQFLELRNGKLWWHLTTIEATEPFTVGPDDDVPPDVRREDARLRRLSSAAFVGTIVLAVLALLFAPPAPRVVPRPAEITEIKIKVPKRVAAAAALPIPAPAVKSFAIEVTRPPEPPRWQVEKQFEPVATAAPEQPRSPSLADTINRAAQTGPDIDTRVRSPRQERRRRDKASQGNTSMRLAVSGTGEIDRTEVEAALESHLGEFQRCYVTALNRLPNAKGVVQLEWTITRTGAVSDAVVLRSDIADDSLLRCIEEEVRRVRFPAPQEGAVRINYPFVFRSLGE